MTTTDDSARRGLPRPLNDAGLPVPYVAESADRLGKLDDRRFGEVVRDQLCQVCGEVAGERAVGVVWRNQPGFEDRIFNGLLHEGCFRLAYANCPRLRQWPHGMALFRFAVADLPIGSSGAPVLPVEMQVNEVDPATMVDRRMLVAIADHGISFDDYRGSVQRAPGIYAIHGEPEVWKQLGLSEPPDTRPLYIGKAEKSLAGRDVETHFRTGRTGNSTLRRSLAALLRKPLDLRAQPRNPSNPGSHANFGLERSGDDRLTTWMREHLRLATWPSPTGVILGELETSVLIALEPPLNLDKVRTPWRDQVRVARKQMADEARAWESRG